ncbi:unnamed protein product [Caenorhabditis auriculariae]|uniref:HORMA domain-containing protein n=1 Tax=Caenorhabditis auriculariae TaxID=2777116 RepID=A0A8S1H9R8_9PELO|nr:unnamed protein product [Caenorhabditis auriculariae]
MTMMATLDESDLFSQNSGSFWGSSEVSTLIEGSSESTNIFLSNCIYVTCCAILRGRKLFNEKAFEPLKVSDTVKSYVMNQTTSMGAKVFKKFHGIQEAIENRYLRNLALIVGTGEDEDSAIEAFTWKVYYDQEGRPHADLEGVVENDRKELGKIGYEGPANLKKQFLSIITHLDHLFTTLSPLPLDAVPSFRLAYSPGTPKDYQPPGFESCPVFFRIPRHYAYDVGNMRFPKHLIKLNCRTMCTEQVLEESPFSSSNDSDRRRPLYHTQRRSDRPSSKKRAEDQNEEDFDLNLIAEHNFDEQNFDESAPTEQIRESSPDLFQPLAEPHSPALREIHSRREADNKTPQTRKRGAVVRELSDGSLEQETKSASEHDSENESRDRLYDSSSPTPPKRRTLNKSQAQRVQKVVKDLFVETTRRTRVFSMEDDDEAEKENENLNTVEEIQEEQPIFGSTVVEIGSSQTAVETRKIDLSSQPIAARLASLADSIQFFDSDETAMPKSSSGPTQEIPETLSPETAESRKRRKTDTAVVVRQQRFGRTEDFFVESAPPAVPMKEKKESSKMKDASSARRKLFCRTSPLNTPEGSSAESRQAHQGTSESFSESASRRFVRSSPIRRSNI